MCCRIKTTNWFASLIAAVILWSLPARMGAAEDSPAKFALLVGCSDYQHLKGANLRGPKNDVRELAATLQKEFGFIPGNIKQLVGWAANEKEAALRPTRANILRELDQLAAAAEKAGAGTQVVIAFSGHGTRVPLPENQHPFDPKNTEPDGLDEAFVAADAQLVGGEMQNLILDNELGERLEKIRAQGTHIWAIFDCCHSGTLARGAGPDDDGEVSRELTPEQLGIAHDVVKQAEAKAAAARAEQPAEQSQVPAELSIFDAAPADTSTRGSLVAFYAAQAFEKAPDLACPSTAPKIDSNYFGLLTYSTLQTLLRERSGKKLTYRELGQTIIGRYRAERGTRGPTPNFGGDLDREVLGFREWPGRSQILLTPEGGKWEINAGELQGLAQGSVLAVYPPVAAAKQTDSPLGYVRVTRSTPTSARVESIEYNSLPALAADKLQSSLRCEIVSRQMGDLRVKLHIAASSDPALAPIVPRIQDILKSPETKLGALIEVTDDKTAPWQLRAVSPAEALAEYQTKITAPAVFLVRRGEEAKAGDQATTDRVWRQYDPRFAQPRDQAVLAAAISDDLRKVFTWHNLWRIAGLGRELASVNCDVKVELAKIKDLKDTSGGTPLTSTELQSGDWLELRIANDGIDRVWVTLVLLDSDYSVLVKSTQQLNRPGESDSALEPLRFRVNARQRGPQSALVIATSAEAGLPDGPDYKFLNQKGLGGDPRVLVASDRAGDSPLQAFALAVAGQQGGFRGNVETSPKNPALILRSWTTSPAATR